MLYLPVQIEPQPTLMFGFLASFLQIVVGRGLGALGGRIVLDFLQSLLQEANFESSCVQQELIDLRTSCSALLL